MSVKFSVGARLRKIQINLPDLFLGLLDLPWAQLEELTMTPPIRTRFWATPNLNLDLINALDVLRRLPNLRRCTLAIDCRDEFTLMPAPVVLPNLQNLFIYMGPVQFGLFLQAIGMPKLEKLTIYKRWSRPALQSFFSGANHPIEELGFVTCLMMTSLVALNWSLRSPISTVLHRSENSCCVSSIPDQSASCLCPHLS